jgi:hypothetical protein
MSSSNRAAIMAALFDAHDEDELPRPLVLPVGWSIAGVRFVTISNPDYYGGDSAYGNEICFMALPDGYRLRQELCPRYTDGTETTPDLRLSVLKMTDQELYMHLLDEYPRWDIRHIDLDVPEAEEASRLGYVPAWDPDEIRKGDG